MEPTARNELITLLSPDRFSTYRLKSASDDEAVRLYTWNIAVSSAFWGSLTVLEVLSRNAIHRQLMRLFKRSDWWNHDEAALVNPQRRQLSAAFEQLQKRKILAPSDGQVIAELPFGFWVGLIGRGHPHNYERQLWQPALRHAFPYFRGHRKTLHARLDHLRLFRNRIAHHEPIFSRHLTKDSESIAEVVGYLSSVARSWLLAHSRVQHILGQRPCVTDMNIGLAF